jgi:hypothetical protein
MSYDSDSSIGDGDRVSRRDALKLTAGSVTGTVAGILTVDPVAASNPTYDNYEERLVGSGGDYKHCIGAGVEVTNEFVDQSDNYQVHMDLGGDGVVVTSDGEPIGGEGWYNGIPSEPDRCMRFDNSIFAWTQGFKIDVSGDVSVDIDRNDDDEHYMFPDDCATNDGGDTYETIAKTGLELAAGVVPYGEAVLAGAKVADELFGFTRESDYDLTRYYGQSGNRIVRGAFGMDEFIIICDRYDYGTVRVYNEFGSAKTGFSIYVSYADPQRNDPYYEVSKM